MMLRSLTIGALLAISSGCYSHVYHVRKASHDHAEVAIDRIKPHSSVKWGTWWGVGYVWEPLGCFYENDDESHPVDGMDSDDKCVSYHPLCENGVGRVEVQPVAYFIPITVLTLGAFYAADITAYCSTESSPDRDTGPDGPSGPDGPTGPDEAQADETPRAHVTDARSNGAAHARALH